MNYWDTSALLKLYVPEPDSQTFLRLIAESSDSIAFSMVGSAEILCAVNRRERAGDLKRGGAVSAFRRFLEDCRMGHIVRIPCGDEVLSEAESVVKKVFLSSKSPLVRSLDLIHVASALTVLAQAVVATDLRLREIARLVNLRCVP